MNLAKLKDLFLKLCPKVDQAQCRYIKEHKEHISVRQNVLQPSNNTLDEGVMIHLVHQGGMGYGATSDLSEKGISNAIEQAIKWCSLSSGKCIALPSLLPLTNHKQGFPLHTPKQISWDSWNFKTKVEWLTERNIQLKTHETIVDWESFLSNIEYESYLLDQNGQSIHQSQTILIPSVSVTANKDSITQARSYGGYRSGRQGGLELLESMRLIENASRISVEALELLDAPSCPNETMDLILSPDQMILQIHESIGHPLELDRILGDERNYAGTSFVTEDMFGNYQYGSEHLNIEFNPHLETQMASYAYDDDGLEAKPTLMIDKGILKCPLGASFSQARANSIGVANSRACSWNRPPIDRMANLNLVPGQPSFKELISQVENGVYMEGNNSWSIDDSRNKFQFGCEYGRLIKNGELKEVVRDPGYRGISANFWRNLKAVGNAESLEILGTPNCGKGEPNQVIRVGHATPPALFSNIEIFGGES